MEHGHITNTSQSNHALIEITQLLQPRIHVLPHQPHVSMVEVVNSLVQEATFASVTVDLLAPTAKHVCIYTMYEIL